MPGEIRVITELLLLMFLLFSLYGVSGLPSGLCLPKNGSYVFGVYSPGDPGNVRAENISELYSYFSNNVGIKNTIGVISDEWNSDQKFPTDSAKNLSKNGITPFIFLMIRSSTSPYQKEPVYTLQNIVNGKFDQYLVQWARDARALGTPIFIDFGTEVNQWKYPWNGYWNREDKGTESFKEAYRHIHDIMVQEGASNLIWVYHINAYSQPSEAWNNITSYYPGDDYCDLISVSIYGSQNPFETGTGSLKDTMNMVTSNLSSDSIQKPVFIILGTDVHNKILDPASWVKDVFTSLSENTWSSVKGIIWYNTAWKNDGNPLHDTSMRLSDNKTVEKAFKESIMGVSIKENLIC